jgi:hypothetical protein
MDFSLERMEKKKDHGAGYSPVLKGSFLPTFVTKTFHCPAFSGIFKPEVILWETYRNGSRPGA